MKRLGFTLTGLLAVLLLSQNAPKEELKLLDSESAAIVSVDEVNLLQNDDFQRN